jgi:hypothetical protein
MEISLITLRIMSTLWTCIETVLVLHSDLHASFSATRVAPMAKHAACRHASELLTEMLKISVLHDLHEVLSMLLD